MSKEGIHGEDCFNNETAGNVEGDYFRVKKKGGETVIATV